MSKEIGFSVADDIKDFVDFYADIRLTTPSAMAKKGMVAEMIRHPLQATQIAEYERTHGGVPMACIPARCRTGTVHYISSLNSLKNQESSEEQEVIEYLNLKTGREFKARNSATKRHIGARLREGWKLDDFKAVIDFKVKEWGGDPKMAQYLRPETLFGTKFESYVQVARSGRTVKPAADKHPCPQCGAECSRLFGYWTCPTHGQEADAG